MNRREFLTWTAAAGVSATIGQSLAYGSSDRRPLFAPHFGMFRYLAGDDPVAQIAWAAEHGFQAFEDLWIADRTPDDQERIGMALSRAGMTFGMMSGVVDFSSPSFTSGRKECRVRVLQSLDASLECADRTGARWCAAVTGRRDPGVAAPQQSQNLLGLLAECADRCARRGVVLVIEPVDAAGYAGPMAVPSLEDAANLSRKLAHPALGVVCDVYELARNRSETATSSEVTADVIGRLEAVLDQVRYVQWGDFPGRKEPGTGVLDFGRIATFLKSSRYDGPIAMDHGNAAAGRDGELAVLNAYCALDERISIPPI